MRRTKNRGLFFVKVLPLLFLIMLNTSAIKAFEGEEMYQQKMAAELIEGHIFNETGEPLQGVAVLEKGTTNGTISDKDGYFTISTEKNPVLIFSAVGYQSQEVRVQTQKVLKVIMSVNETQLGEVVVIGYGTARKSDITSAVTSLQMKEVEDRPITNVGNALMGRLAGVRVQSATGGQPGSGLKIQVRGVGSINGGTGPLYVVDGVPLDGDINNIGIKDIASIEVLKDAASAAIYGSRGSNGVVLITTKQGKQGGPEINLNVQGGIQEVLKTYSVMDRDQWIDFAIEERTNTYILNGGDPSVPIDQRPGLLAINPEWISNPEKFPNTDWATLIYRKASFQDYNLSISGGGGSTTYYFGAEYLNQNGVMINSGYKRYSLVANIESKIKKVIDLGLKLNSNIANSTDPDAANLGGPISRAALMPPIVSSDQNTFETGSNPWVLTALVNPYKWAQQVINPSNTSGTIASFYTQINLSDNLNFRSTVSTELKNYRNNYFMPNNINRGNGSIGEFSTSRTINLVNDNIVTYENTLGKGHLNAIAGFTAQKIDVQSNSARGTGFPNDAVKTLNAATQILSATSFSTGRRLLSYLARGMYSYDNKYLLTASIRRDGSSQFGRNNKWGWFPSVSVGWRIDQEDFMRDSKLFNDLKVRASYGLTGNNSFPSGNDYPSIGALTQANYVFGTALGAKVIGQRQSTISNPNLTWEKNKSFDVGIDFGLWSGRVFGSVDFYNRLTYDLLLNLPVPQITGFSNAWQNIGRVLNRGVEVEINTWPLRGESFQWQIGGNIAYNKNIVRELGPDNTPIPGLARGTEMAITKVGYPIGSYFLIPVSGIFQTREEVEHEPVSKVQNPGDLKYKDTNGDGKIDDQDRAIVGHNNPDFTWGISNSFKYKNWSLSVLIDGEWGNHLVSSSMAGEGQSRQNQLTLFLNRWKSVDEPGNGKVPRAAITSNLTTASTFWMFDASHVMIRNVSLGYTISSITLSKLGIGALNTYFGVDNVALFDHYFGNPQSGAQYSDPLVPGIDAINTYPLSRTFTLGLKITLK